MSKITKILWKINPFAKGKKMYSIIHLKCPRCQESNLFTERNPYILKMLDKMPHQCPVCGESFRRELSFYYGAMMVSHALTTLIAVVVHAISYYFWAWNIAYHLTLTISTILILFPVVFRFSRAVWINFFVTYKGNTSFKPD